VNFFGVGYQEIILVFVLMLIFVGPERMPTVAYQIGRAVRTMQKYARAVRDEFSEEIGYIEEQVRTVKGEVETTRAAIRESQAEFQADLNSIAPAPSSSLSSLLGADTLGLGAPVSIAGESGTSPSPPDNPSDPASPPADPDPAAPASAPLVF
jgi:sec-independent protein translocase protein TatB